VFWLVTVGTLAADQIAKLRIRSTMTPNESIPLVQDVFHLTYVRNAGAAFGLFPGRQSIFMLTTAVVLFVIAAYWRRSRPTAWPIVIALGLIAGGSIGNLIDRATLGRVTDFFDFTLIDFPVFNIADSAIVIGVGILIAWLLLVPENPQAVGEHVAPVLQSDDARQDATS
jgi:signal peptidase II